MIENTLQSFVGHTVTAAAWGYTQPGMDEYLTNHDYDIRDARAPEGMNFDYYQLSNEAQPNREVEQFKIIQSFASDLLENIKDLDPKFSRTVDNHFWDLI
jgi:hypothetical protein